MGHQVKRKISNLLIDRKYQLNFILFFVLYGVIATFSSLLIIAFLEKKLFDKLFTYGQSLVDPKIILDIIGTIEQVSVYIIAFTLFYSIFGALVALILSHRVSGPLVAIRRHINKLKEGDYASQLKLRKDDELKILEKELNELSEILKNQSQKKT